MTTVSAGLGGLVGAREFSSDRKPNKGLRKVVSIDPRDTIQDFVKANPAGTTFVLQPGVYRMQSVIPKNGDIFIGQPGAILNGSNLLTMFSRETIKGVSYWVAAGPSQRLRIHAHCEITHPLCGYPEDFFIDNQLLLRVGSLGDVTTGACYFEYSTAKIYFLDNPTGHVVEISKTNMAFAGGDNVTIQGLVIEKYANPAQMGVIGDHQAGNGWIIRNNEVRWNHGTGIKVGNAARLVGNYIHDNGQLGIFGTSGALIENNEIARNNWAGFSVNWEAGGAKFGNAQNLIVRGNYLHENVGDGLWADGNSSGGLYENNIIVNNGKNGVAHEISHIWTIRNNVIIGNGFGTQSGHPMLGVGIIVNESDHVDIYSNFVANNYKGIVLNMSFRNDCTVHGTPYVCDLNNDSVHDNTVVQSNGVAGALYENVNNDDYYRQKSNHFVNNRYCLGNSMPGRTYWWRNDYRSQAQWVAQGEDAPGALSCPGVFVSSPGNGNIVSGWVTVTAFAADSLALRTLRLYVDGKAVTTSTNTMTYIYPCISMQAGMGITYKWDANKVNDGDHTLRVEAYNTRNQSSNASIDLTVKNH
jgi:hypothetical protein